MKTKITLIALLAIIIAACGTSKKNTSSSVATAPTPPPAPVAPPVPSTVYMITKSPDGIYEPGDEELIAIQSQYKDATLDQLKQGHALYTMGACIRCHTAQNIYKYDETRWKYIMDDMAQKAAMNDAQKDAVYKYVLAIKAAQPKGAK